TGRIRDFIQNKGKTPAYQIKIEHWSEVSKPMQRCATVVPVPEGFDPDNVTFFEKAYDTRQSVLPDYGGASASARMDMLLPETEPIEYLLNDHTERLIKALQLDRAQVRQGGKGSYT